MPPKKQFNDGHLTQNTAEVGFLREAFIREARCRDTFNLSTAIEQIETKGTITLSPKRDVPLQRTLCDVARAEALRRRKELMQEELEHIKGILRHKQICMRAGGTVKTLHPALTQTSTLELKAPDFTM